MLALTGMAHAKVFELSRGKIQIEVPKDWQDAEGLFGVPLTLLGPMKAQARPVVSITPTGKAGLKFDPAKLTDISEYKKGRERWLKKHHGEALEYFPYKKVQWPGIAEAHEIGFRYRISKIEFIEKSYYVFCHDKLFHLKTLLRAGHAADYSTTVENTVRSFSCL